MILARPGQAARGGGAEYRPTRLPARRQGQVVSCSRREQRAEGPQCSDSGATQIFCTYSSVHAYPGRTRTPDPPRDVAPNRYVAPVPTGLRTAPPPAGPWNGHSLMRRNASRLSSPRPIPRPPAGDAIPPRTSVPRGAVLTRRQSQPRSPAIGDHATLGRTCAWQACHGHVSSTGGPPPLASPASGDPHPGRAHWT